MRRTVNLPDAIDRLVELASEEGESYSATVTRLLEDAIERDEDTVPDWIGSADGPDDLGRRAEEYLREPAE